MAECKKCWACGTLKPVSELVVHMSKKQNPFLVCKKFDAARNSCWTEAESEAWEQKKKQQIFNELVTKSDDGDDIYQPASASASASPSPSTSIENRVKVLEDAMEALETRVREQQQAIDILKRARRSRSPKRYYPRTG